MLDPLVPLLAAVPRASGRLSSTLPLRESRGRRAGIRLLALVAIFATSIYLIWRAAATLDMSVWWLALPLLGLEVHALLSLLLFVVPLWDLDAAPAAREVDETTLRVAVFIPTYNEPLDVLLPTVAAAVSVALPHETWVLDDGNRQAVADLAASLGAQYLARPIHDHAKAGNVNYALSRVSADVIVLLDADHVADRNLLRHTLAHFDDPELALVQTPQDFYNVDSFEHQQRRARWLPWSRAAATAPQRFSEQELFYRGLQPGRNRLDAAFCCGTGALLRTSALRAVGGLATETVTEDIHTTIRLHRAGWKTVYHNEVLARGLAAADAVQYLQQRVRWGTGAMQVLRHENPAYVSGLTLKQRVSYLGPLLGWFDSWRSLGYLLAPMAVVTTGAVPVRANALTFGLAFGVVFVLQRWALHALARGMAPQGIATVFELVRLPATLLATTRLVSRKERAFSVTTKGRTGDRRERMPVPALLVGLLVASVVCAGWFGATMLGFTPTTYRVPWAAYAAFGWLVVNGALVLVAVGRIRHQRFGAERRASIRFTVTGTAYLDGLPAVLLDTSLTGALLLVDREARGIPAVGAQVALAMNLDERMLRLEAVVRSVRPPRSARSSVRTGPDGFVLGLELAPGQNRARADLARALFAGDAEPHLVWPAVPQPREPMHSDTVLAPL